MTDSEITELTESWIAFWHAPEGSAERASLRRVTSLELKLVREQPLRTWQFILEVLQRDQSWKILSVLSAGPLEDLLVYHGEAMIETIEAEARVNPQFAKLLGGVWQNAIPDHIWARVQRAWDRRGWDGNPE